MFAKPFHTSGNSRLKGKDVKKFRVDLLKSCSIDANANVAWNILAKAEIVKIKLAAPSRTVLYTDVTTNVLAFDVQGKGDVIPTVYLLWNEPALRELLPPLVVHSPVSHYLLRGADPMLPGVVKACQSSAPFIKGQLRAVYVNGNPMPFAIGDMLVDDDAIASQGWKGKAMQLLHVVFDELTKMGPQHVFPDGFSDDQIHAIGDSEPPSMDVLQVNDDEEEKPPAKPIDVSDIEIDDDDQQDREVMSQAEMNDLLERCFYQAMKRVKPSDAPMLASQFYASLVLPSRPVGSVINLKATSYKKISVFLKEMEARGIIELKEQDGVQTITFFRKTHPDVARHQLHSSELDAAEEAEAAETAGVFIPGKHAPEVIQLYRLTQQTQSIAPGVNDFMYLADVKKVLNDYIAKNELVSRAEPQFVRLDMHLTDALYSSKKKPESGYPDKLHRQEVLQLYLSRLRPYHFVQLYPKQEATPVAGEFRPIHIKTELSKRQKPVTIVSNIKQFGLDPETFSKEAQKKWACSATLLPVGKDIEVHIQGNLGQDVVGYLGKQYKINSKYCVAEWGKGLKPKK
ncbi:hypothetical protein AeMF1_002668 [Aphanomyces euteiches]|nr:hypothetical protein AeMF1_002668 [Aphanomyces euteiches]KAH9191350.1 hypothetical protein AeNC1_006679 [Aphanomyces euteiches]